MIDLLYHATIYYEIRKYIQESVPASLKYEMVIEKAKAHEHNVLEYKDHQTSHGGANSAPSYNNPLLTAHALTKRRPSGRNTCHWCGKSHERGNCPVYGKTCDKCKGMNHFKAVCYSKVTAAKTAARPYKGKKPPPRRASTGSNGGHGKGGGRQHQKKRMPKKPPQKQKAYAFRSKTRSHQQHMLHLVEARKRTVKYHIKRRSFQDQRKKVCTTGFLALQFIVKCLKAPTLGVSLWKGCTQTLTQTIGLRSLQM